MRQIAQESNNANEKPSAKADCFVPHKLISLLDMNRLFASDIFALVKKVEIFRDRLEKHPEQLAQLTSEGVGNDMETAFALSWEAEVEGGKYEFSKVVDAALNIKVLIQAARSDSPYPKPPDCSYSAIKTLFGILWQAIFLELAERRFAYIPKDRAKFFEMDNLFGADVSKTFPEIADDLKAAGNCIAADLHTAAIFHLTRITGMGIRQMARKTKLPLPEIGSASFRQENWGKFIKEYDERQKEIERELELVKDERGKINQKKNLDDSDKKRLETILGQISALEKECVFLTELSVSVKGLKRLYRDPISHECEPAKEGEDKIAFSAVKDFMEALSDRI